MNINGKTNVGGLELSDFLTKHLVGQRLKSIKNTIDGYELLLENGTTLTIELNEGCGGCGNGWSELELSPENPSLEAAVMNVEFKEDSNFKDNEKFSIFLYLNDLETVEFQGYEGAGNGYYGYGYWVKVTKVDLESKFRKG